MRMCMWVWVHLAQRICLPGAHRVQAAVRAERGLPDDLVRISGGIEDVNDLIADLEAAMKLAMTAIGFDPANPTPGTCCGAALVLL